MNPNIPYGHVPMQSSQRRHDVPYGQMPPHMRPHTAYPQYYPPPMGPMMPQYQHYPQTWYPYQNHMPPHHAGRHTYYPQHAPMYASAQAQQHQQQQQHQHQQQSPVIVSSQPHSHASPRHVHPAQSYQPIPSPSSTAPTPQEPTIIPQSTNSIGDPQPTTDATIPIIPSVPTTQLDTVAVEGQLQDSKPFHPPVPWLSVQDKPFPPRAVRPRRRVLRSAMGTEPITFPLVKDDDAYTENLASPDTTGEGTYNKEEALILVPSSTTTPLPSDTPDNISTQPTTPSSTVVPGYEKAQATPTQSKVGKAAVPVVPVLPLLPNSLNASRSHRDSVISTNSQTENGAGDSHDFNAELSAEMTQQDEAADTAPPPPPTSWAALLRNKNPIHPATIGNARTPVTANGLGANRSESLGDVLNQIVIEDISTKLSFLQPRGLVNTGNMCYMNSVLQMLVFCIPFYEFLDRVARKASHAFKSDTPLIDAMIMFMREYSIIDSTSSVEQLRLRLNPEDYERYGDSFIPEYVYNVIKQLPKFRDMRRGHQQDAQEFLGFLLEELHEECANAMRYGNASSSGRSTPIDNTSSTSEAADKEGGWMEVGHKQKAAVTRSSGAITTESPVTGIFGGKLRSELKVAGNKLSVTLEPYQPLQLDIGSPQVNNIIDALKGLTRPESMQGDFQSARGPTTTATKQVFIETLPPVLILHLKRFHYDASTMRVEKIWKKIGYPLELEMPKEVFPTSTRNKYASHGGLPKYRLIGVIYHHGKNASGGHYTVDIRRQDGREWIRVDDTIIRRVRSEDVAEGGSEEDPKVLAAALEQHKHGKGNMNRFEQIDDEEEAGGPDKVWNHVNGHSRTKSTVNSLLNGQSTPAQNTSGQQTPRDRSSLKDNKVAYLLFYQRMLS